MKSRHELLNIPLGLYRSLQAGRCWLRYALGPALISGVIATVGIMPGFAEEQPAIAHTEFPVSPGSKEFTDWRRLMEQLGSKSYASRRQAFTELWQLGIQTEPFLNEALLSGDKQIVESARRLVLLNKIRPHCDDIQVASELVELFLSPSDENLATLATDGYWELAQLFLLEHPAYAIRSKESFFQQGTSRGLIQLLVDQALLQSNVDSAWPLIARLIPSELAFWTAHHLNLPEVEPPEDLHERAMQLFIQGRVVEALELPIPWPLKLRLAVRGFQWPQLSHPAIQAALLGDQTTIGGQAAKAVLLEFAGNRTEAQQIWRQTLDAPLVGANEFNAEFDDVDADEESLDSIADWDETEAALQILKTLTDSPSDPTSMDQLQLALLLSGKVAPVERFLEELSPEAAFDFYIAKSDYSNAFRQLGLDENLDNLDQWIDKQVAEARALLPQASRNPAQDSGGLTPAMSLGKVGSLLTGLGYRDQSARILEELVSLGQRGARRQNPIWDRCILRWIGRDEWRASCLEIVSRRIDDLPKHHQTTIFSKLFSELDDNAWILFLTAPAMAGEAESPPNGRLAIQQLEHLQRCDPSAFGDNAIEVIKDWLIRAADRELSTSQSVDVDSSVSRTGLAKIAHDWGQSRLALDFLQADLSRSGDAYASAQLAATICLELQQPENALQFLNLYRPGPLDQHRDLPIRIHALLALGQWEKAQQEYLAHWLRMSAVSWNGDRSAGYRASEDLMSEKKWEEALPFAERNFVLDRFGSYFFGFWEARQYSRILQELKQFDRSADVMRAVIVELLRPFSQTLRFFVENNELGLLRYVAARERLSRAMSLIEQNDHVAATQQLEVAFQLQPLDIEAVISCYPLWIDAGLKQEAEALFRQYQSALRTHLEQWPDDAMNLNNLAWMYAQCELELDEALDLSERAVRLAPSSSVYLDTLAEVHFRLGNATRAIELMRQCVAMDPREAHYRENLVRYKQGLQP